MAVTNTGIVLRTITGVNESDLFLDSEATSTATNTGIVERSILGVHDANFVHPLGDELVLNNGFDTDSSWTTNDWIIANGIATATNIANSLNQSLSVTLGATYSVSINVLYSDDVLGLRVKVGGVFSDYLQEGLHTFLITTAGTQSLQIVPRSSSSTYSIDNISVKEVLVNRESTVNNTGIVERPITGVNESDPMFPDNTISNIRNINDTTLYEELLEALQLRATYYENEEGTTEILTNLFNC